MLGGVSAESSRILITLFEELTQREPDTLITVDFIGRIQFSCLPFRLHRRTNYPHRDRGNKNDADNDCKGYDHWNSYSRLVQLLESKL